MAVRLAYDRTQELSTSHHRHVSPDFKSGLVQYNAEISWEYLYLGKVPQIAVLLTAENMTVSES